MITEFQDMEDGHLRDITAVKHGLELTIPGVRPIYCAPYRAGPRTQAVEKDEIERMLKSDVIEPNNTNCAVSIVFAPKKDGKLRSCGDYRRLNGSNHQGLIPHYQNGRVLDTLGDADVIFTMDANFLYSQLEIEKQDQDNTAFSSHHGLHLLKRMPFGQKKALSTFQISMNVILSYAKCQFSLVYLDHVIIFSQTLREHINHVQTVLTMLKLVRVSLELPNCSFCTHRIDYLGHVIQSGRLALSERTAKEIEGLGTCMDVT